MRYQSLDHWRGVAALAVVVFHGFGGIRSAGLEVHDSVQWMKTVSDFGWFGVHLFFVISGFCIAANVSILWRKGEGAWAFLEDRFLRIYPVYWLACLVSLASHAAASPFNKVPLSTFLPGEWDRALANIFLVEPYFGYDPFLIVSWTLVFEVGFYILVGAGVALRRAGVNQWLLFGGALILAIWGLSAPHYGATFVLNFWPEFLLGAVVYLALAPGSRYRAAWLIVPALFAGVGYFTLEPAARVYQMLGATAFAYVLYFLYPWDAKVAGWKSLHWLAWVGVISYSLYLTHAFLGLRIINLTTRLFDHTSPWHLVLHPVAWILAVFTAWLFYRWCELPVDNFRRRVKKRRQLREGEGTSSGSPPATA